MLGMHPEVSCPSEQDFEAIARNIETFVPDYNKDLRVYDRRTGGQGAPTVDMNISRAILRDTILNLSRGFAGDKPVHGLNHNSVFAKLKFYDDLFESPPLICIFRDPVDRAISTWNNNHRLAKEEKDRATDHLKLLENPEGTLEGYVRLQAAGFNSMVRRFCDYAEGRSNILTMRYESLVEDRMDELRRLFSFLEVDASPRVLEPIVKQSSRENMIAQSAHPAFFGLDESGKNQTTVSAEVRIQALRGCSEGLERLGYEPV